MQKVLFFFTSLNHFFIKTTYQRFSTGPAQARKQSASTKTCFFLQNKGSNNPIQGTLTLFFCVVKPLYEHFSD